MTGEDPKGETPSTIDNIETAVGVQLKNLSGLLDGGMNVASDAIKSSTALVKDEIENVTGLAKSWYHRAEIGIAQADEALMTTLKKGVAIAVENEIASTAAAATTLALLLPTTRRLLWRSTFGRFQSAEAAQRAAEQRIVSLGEVIDSQAPELEKLAAQLATARDQYTASLAQLKGAASELRGLASKVDSTDRKARVLMQDLRELRSKHALQMRSDLAIKSSVLAKQKAAVDKVVAKLAKEGF
ncbi:hypothetical protein Ndes2526B_g03128 [Nannochloris sp. 'desiccata']|nr:hypothetical protein KSW81_006637 [Chlorella desiccata (nom. nud.)]